MKHFLLTCSLLLGLAGLGNATPFREEDAVARLFRAQQVNGTLAVYDTHSGTIAGYNGPRAVERFAPASTFKIAHSLIGLDTGTVSSVDEVFFHYDGQPAYLDTWKQDMNLRQAIAVSNLLAYQQLARQIGLKQERQQLAQLQYGNAKTGKDVTTFWIDNTLRISAIEQTQFLARLATGTLPYPAEQQAAVRDIVKLDSGSGWTLYGKTGWATASKPGVGWFVGWLEREGHIYSFALNMQIDDASQLPQRVTLARQALAALGLMTED
ncbi:class D beta-lactamase [Chitinilyticum piscinae]|uniref:Beta-lactamase n=1 Tax=Chitinilyticum piscinae TaxID=2866724 RepID=A0A8J7FIQ6_9NEIS|nr:class D beta-lactamase [Chitinilyticum piscinae]MBE9608172.1 class D beta-lactamase [Chitinilyticum piscinae]